jgi:lysyl-tRNA synthetase class 1
MSNHWADETARKLIKSKPDQSSFVVAAGITPSGVVHLGNFREVITADVVGRALRDAGKDVRFIFSWDDFDVFRKLPEGAPKELEQHLRESVSQVPDFLGKSDSYAGHFIEQFEAELADMGVAPETIRQSRRYRAGMYADGIRLALDQRDLIRELLDKHRTEPTPQDWLPISGFCDNCGKDEITFHLSDSGLTYDCRVCGHATSVDLAAGGNVKLPWRIDWPMRWAFERVDFEPGGKDHSSAGGSYDTGKDIVQRVYGWAAPAYVAYEFVLPKGDTKKLSSSSGRAVTVRDCLQIYSAEMIRWLFTRCSPRAEIRVAFDHDVIQVFEEFDRAVRQARANRSAPGARAVELAQVASRPSLLDSSYEPPSFRKVTTVLQALDGHSGRTFAALESAGLGDAGALWLKERIAFAAAWLDLHAPKEFVYRVRQRPVTRTLDAPLLAALRALVGCLARTPTDDELVAQLKAIGTFEGIDVNAFFAVVYDLLIDRPKGPRLSTLLSSIGAARAVGLLEPSVTALDAPVARELLKESP